MSQNFVQRARIVLALNAGESPKAVAERLETSTPTVFKWRNRYIEQGLSGLQDAPRLGQPRKLDPKKVKSILDDTVKKLPKESTHWSVRLMAEYAGASRWQVHQIWKAADLKPHRLKTFKISNNYRTRRQLALLPDAMLKDIGVSRSDAEEEASKVFWKD